MAVPPGPPNPSAPGLYADVLWNTALLPDFVIDNTGAKRNKIGGTPASINGVVWTDENPRNSVDMIANVSDRISRLIYGIPFRDLAGVISGYYVLQSTYTTTSGPPDTTTAQNIPSRYVVMGGAATPGLPSQQADQLIVTSATPTGFTFLQTDYRTPPDYTQSPIQP